MVGVSVAGRERRPRAFGAVGAEGHAGEVYTGHAVALGYGNGDGVAPEG